ncbi:UbiE/COQ5 family methyltransferase [Penicillium atrosanguineum]|uniref:ATPase AAA-type core n=1 Tax=Penicillium atrosanguineum TaxID=1132637 RepID=UPI00239501A5|nr:ATPase AAA-type core [Penicillium atrosanguineum]KAJ5127833.1 UbiE/COQ5 family methyltransferase [Penicillium atrosanguineum]KAJ5313489.1 ATPase AAA-type core [Penicillium atrosanguineum]
MNSGDTYRSVQGRYAEVASYTNDARKHGGYERKVASAFGYDVEDLCSIPENANLGVSCGNPLATANIGVGEVVIDLGSGGGIDVLLAAKKVGVEGKAIGIDMTKWDMLELARRNARDAGVPNASFIEAFITSIPLPSSTADCIISNCVINLVPEVEKPRVFQEIFRLLKPGGRVAISDILAKQELPMEIKKDLSLYVGCIAGASQVSDYERYLQEAGFQDATILDTHADLNLYKEIWTRKEANEPGPTGSCCDSMNNTTSGEINQLPDVDFNFWTGTFIYKDI